MCISEYTANLAVRIVCGIYASVYNLVLLIRCKQNSFPPIDELPKGDDVNGMLLNLIILLLHTPFPFPCHSSCYIISTDSSYILSLTIYLLASSSQCTGENRTKGKRDAGQ